MALTKTRIPFNLTEIDTISFSIDSGGSTLSTLYTCPSGKVAKLFVEYIFMSFSHNYNTSSDKTISFGAWFGYTGGTTTNLFNSISNLNLVSVSNGGSMSYNLLQRSLTANLLNSEQVTFNTIRSESFAINTFAGTYSNYVYQSTYSTGAATFMTAGQQLYYSKFYSRGSVLAGPNPISNTRTIAASFLVYEEDAIL